MAQVLIFPADRFPATLNWQAVSFMRVEWSFIDFCPPYETYPFRRSGRPTKLDGVRMMLFGSDRGIAARDSLMNSPLQVPFAW